MEVHPEKKVAPARKTKVATGTKAKAKVVKSGTATQGETVVSGAESTTPATAPTLPIIPPYGTQAYFSYYRELRRDMMAKHRIAKRKKMDREDIILAKDIEDSEDESKPKKAKKTKTKTKQKKNEEAVTAARSTGSVSASSSDMGD